MGKTVRVKTSQPGQKPVTSLATVAEADKGFPTFEPPDAVEEVYGFGRAADDGSDDASPDVAPPGFNTIQEALAAERLARQATAVSEPAEDLEDEPEDTLAVENVGDHPAAETDGDEAVGAQDDEAAADSTNQSPTGMSAADRDALLAHLTQSVPPAVRDLVSGNTVGELLASAKRATAVHDQIVASVRASVPVSAGGSARGGMDPNVAKMSPVQKIAHGVRQARAG